MYKKADLLGSMPFNLCEVHNGTVPSKHSPSVRLVNARRAQCCPKPGIHLLA